MKNRPMIALIALGLLVAAPRGLGETETKAEALISHARSVLMTPNISRDDVTAALAEALEASLLIMPKTDYADEFKSRVEVAKKMFEEKELFAGKLRQYLGLSYKLVNAGKAWQLPDELNQAYQLRPDIAQVTKTCEKLLDSALTEHKAGRDVESVRCLLEFVILVITPFEA